MRIDLKKAKQKLVEFVEDFKHAYKEMASLENVKDDLEFDESVKEDGANKSKANPNILDAIESCYYSNLALLKNERDELEAKKGQLEQQQDEIVQQGNKAIENLENMAQKEGKSLLDDDVVNLKADIVTEENQKLDQVTSEIENVHNDINRVEQEMKNVETMQPMSFQETSKSAVDSNINSITSGLQEASAEQTLTGLSQQIGSEIKNITNVDDDEQKESTESQEETKSSELTEEEKLLADINNISQELNKNISASVSSDIKKIVGLVVNYTNSKIVQMSNGAEEQIKKTEEQLIMSQNSEKEYKANYEKAEQIIAKQQADLAEKDQTINGLNDTISTKEKENASLQSEIEKQRVEIERLKVFESKFNVMSKAIASFAQPVESVDATMNQELTKAK